MTRSRRNGSAGVRWELVVSLVCFTGLLVVTWALSRRERLPSIGPVSAERLEPLAHVLVGAVLAFIATQLITSVRRRALAGFAVSLAMTTVVEIAQLSSAARSVGLGDLTANAVGAALGAALGWMALRIPERAALRVVAAASAAALLVGLWAVNVDVPLGKSCDHERIAVGGSRSVPPTFDPGDDVVVYDFSTVDAAERVDRVAVEAEPSLFRAGTGAPRATGDALALDEGSDVWLTSLEAGMHVSRQVQRSEIVAIEAVVTPTASTRGPARIVAISRSASPSDMNIHLGQHGDELSVRLRLGCGQFNWTRIDGVFEPGERRHIVAAYEGVRQRIWVDGELVDEREFSGTLVSTINWRPMPLNVGNEASGGRQFVGEIERVAMAWGAAARSGER